LIKLLVKFSKFLFFLRQIVAIRKMVFYADVLVQLRIAWSVNVQAGRTLSGIVREQMAARGVNISSSEALRLSQTVAQSNKLQNANLIYPGQKINLDSLNLTLAQNQMANRAIASTGNSATTNINSSANRQTAVNSTTQLQLLARADQGGNPILEKTLNRAVEKGFIPAQDKQAVMNKIIQLSQQHRFAPDDFARLSLMESDGLNPKASNSRCFGIIQFCDGPDRQSQPASAMPPIPKPSQAAVC
jgi:hypothetical protein